MSRNGSGVYNLPAGNPVVAGTTISTTWANNTLSDIASALTGSVASDGQTPMTGNLNLNNNNINNVASLTAAGTVTALNLTATAATSTVNLSYTGTLTGGTGVINIGSGQIYKDASGNVGIGTTVTGAPLSVQAVATTGLCIDLRGNSGDDSYVRFANNAYSAEIARVGTDGSSLIFGVGSSGTERMRIDSSGNVGIGTSSPTAKLEVNGNIFLNGGSNTLYTTAAELVIQSGTSGLIRFANNNGSNERMRLAAGGGLSIGTTATPPTNGILLPINGVINTNGGTLYSTSVRDTTTGNAANTYIDPTDGYFARSTSSIKYKTNVEDIEQPKYKAIYQMRPVWYRSLGERDRKDWSYYGLIAEEVGEIEPRLVHWAKKEDGTLEAEGVMYERLTVLLLAEMKELRAELDATKAKVAALEGAK